MFKKTEFFQISTEFGHILLILTKNGKPCGFSWIFENLEEMGMKVIFEFRHNFKKFSRQFGHLIMQFQHFFEVFVQFL